MSSRVVEPVRGARALFVFHLALLSWWTFVQFYFRVVAHFVKFELPVDLVNFIFIAIAPIVTTHFALGQRGTPSQTAARVVVVLAALDLLGELLQSAPHLGLPAIVPSDKGAAELLVRGVWVTCEFAMRGAMFIALFRAQADVDKRLVALFFVLLGVNYLATSLSFLRAIGPFTALGNALPLGSLAAKISIPMSPLWLSLIVYLNGRLARGRHPLVDTRGAAALHQG